MRSARGAPRPWIGAASLVAAAILLGCNLVKKSQSASPSAPSTPVAAQARLNLFIVPSPVIVLRDLRRPSARTAQWTVHIFETGGVGGTLSFVNATVRDADTGAPVEPQGFLSMDVSEIRKRVGTDHLAPGGSLAVPQSLAYDSVGSGATLAVAVQLLDDNGNLVSHSTSARLE